MQKFSITPFLVSKPNLDVFLWNTQKHLEKKKTFILFLSILWELFWCSRNELKAIKLSSVFIRFSFFCFLVFGTEKRLEVLEGVSWILFFPFLLVVVLYFLFLLCATIQMGFIELLFYECDKEFDRHFLILMDAIKYCILWFSWNLVNWLMILDGMRRRFHGWVFHFMKFCATINWLFIWELGKNQNQMDFSRLSMKIIITILKLCEI